jgi:hypothetical protein
MASPDYPSRAPPEVMDFDEDNNCIQELVMVINDETILLLNFLVNQDCLFLLLMLLMPIRDFLHVLESSHAASSHFIYMIFSLL